MDHPIIPVLAVLCTIAIVAVAGIYVSEHVTCFQLLGVTKGCVLK